jgi:D-sedoheptulose 7-phosphate isomerase
MSDSFFSPYMNQLAENILNLDQKGLTELSQHIIKVSSSGKKVILAGNGGSAAMAAHVAVDFTKNSGIRAITFNEADLITCFANDFGYEHWIAKSIEYYSDPGDLVILISSSGKSPNVVNAAQISKKLGLKVATFSGFSTDNPLRKLGDFNFWVDCNQYNIVEMTHHSWLLGCVDYVAHKRNS